MYTDEIIIIIEFVVFSVHQVVAPFFVEICAVLALIF